MYQTQEIDLSCTKIQNINHSIYLINNQDEANKFINNFYCNTEFQLYGEVPIGEWFTYRVEYRINSYENPAFIIKVKDLVFTAMDTYSKLSQFVSTDEYIKHINEDHDVKKYIKNK